MPSKKDKRAKGVQMTEQQPKILQIIDIVHTSPTADIVQMPESTDTRHLADGSPDGRSSGRQPIWKDGTVPTKAYIWINGKPCATYRTSSTICLPES